MARTTKTSKQKASKLWPVWVFFITFFISFLMSFLSETALTEVRLPVAVLILFVLILIGIFFDMLGVAVTSGDIVDYNSMAAKRVRGAREAILLVQKASVISSIFNDVIGDICGILSGAMGAAIILSAVGGAGTMTELFASVLMSAGIAAMTVSGKAVGKAIAINKSKQIVFFAGKFLSLFLPQTRNARRKKKK